MLYYPEYTAVARFKKGRKYLLLQPINIDHDRHVKHLLEIIYATP